MGRYVPLLADVRMALGTTLPCYCPVRLALHVPQ